MRARVTHAVFPERVNVLPRKWKNGCGHKDREYLGTVKTGEMILDVYVHEGDLGLADVCMRYGDEGHEYITPGSVLDFLIGSYARKTPEAAALILKSMDFFCERAK